MLCGPPERRDQGGGGGRLTREGIHGHSWPTDTAAQQKPAHHGKAITLQLNINTAHLCHNDTIYCDNDVRQALVSLLLITEEIKAQRY